jgi:histidinol-phosphate aminotransferase
MSDRFKHNIASVRRFIVNDIDRSGFLRLDKNEFNVEFPTPFLDEVKENINSYLLQAYPSTYKANEYASILLEHEEESQILLTAGSDYALKACYEAFVDPGDIVGIPWPTYAMNEVYCSLVGGRIIKFPYCENFLLDQDALFKTLDSTQMVVIANPNQPTGLLEDNDCILQVLTQAQKNNIWVVIDEAYYSFCRSSVASLVEEFDNLIIIRSFSKSYGIAGLRLGAVISQAQNTEYLQKVLPVYSVNSFAIKIMEVLVNYKNFFDEIHKDMILARNRMIQYYNSIGCHAFQSKTNFVMIESNGKMNIDKYKNYLFEKKVIIREPWTSKPYKNAFRVTVSSLENIAKLEAFTSAFLKDNTSE